MGSSFNSPTPNFDNLLIQSLMGRLNLRHPIPTPTLPPYLTPQSLEELLLSDALLNLDDSDDEDDASASSPKSSLAKEESRLEKEIVRIILSGKTDSLKPNSGHAVSIGEHHICIGFHQDAGSDYRVWEWHGHIMLFDEENGYTPEYIYGNYFERVKKQEKKEEEKSDGDEKPDEKEEEEEKVGNMGLKELIESGDSSTSRILHRNLNAKSGSLPRFI